jgi:hypothetical protein
MQGHAECLESAGTEKAIIPSGSQNVAGFPVWHGMLFRNSSNGPRYMHYLMNSLPIHPPAELMSTYGMDNRKCLSASRPCEIGESVSQTENGKVDTARVVATASERIS